MAIMQSILFANAIMLIMFVNQGLSIRCYSCNSYNTTVCALKNLPSDLLVDCDMEPAVGHNGQEYRYTFCRKIKQEIEFRRGKEEISDTRIIRSCGWDTSKYQNQCYERHEYATSQIVCACNSDNCNSSTTLTFSSVLIVLSIFMLFFK